MQYTLYKHFASLINSNLHIQQCLFFCPWTVFEGRPRNKQTIEATAGAVTGEATFEGKLLRFGGENNNGDDDDDDEEEEEEEEEEDDHSNKKDNGNFFSLK